MLSGISIWQLLILLLVVVLVFGTKRLRNIGSDLGSAVRGFRQGMDEASGADTQRLEADPESGSPVKKPAKENDPAARPPGADV